MEQRISCKLVKTQPFTYAARQGMDTAAVGRYLALTVVAGVPRSCRSDCYPTACRALR
jgi:hypothetical protein